MVNIKFKGRKFSSLKIQCKKINELISLMKKKEIDTVSIEAIGPFNGFWILTLDPDNRYQTGVLRLKHYVVWSGFIKVSAFNFLNYSIDCLF